MLAAGAWGTWPHASFGSALLAYGAAWLVLEAVARFVPRALRLSRTQRAALTAVLLIPALSQALRLDDEWLAFEGLDAVDHQTAARLRLEQTPALFPPLVSDDRPQVFHVHAPGAREVGLRLGQGRWLDATALGEGTFRVRYAPREDGPPGQATLRVDGELHTRNLRQVSFQPHPRWLRANPSRTALAAVSEETDAVFVLDHDGLAWRAEVGDGPVDAVFLDDTRLLVMHRYEAQAWVLEGPDTVARRLPTGPFGRRLAVLHREGAAIATAVAVGGPAPAVQVYDADLAPVARVALDAVPDWVAFGRDAGRLVVATRADTALHSFRAGPDGAYAEDRPPLQLGRPAVTMVRSPEGAQLAVATTDYDANGEPHLGNHFVHDQLLRIDVDRWRVLDTTPTARRSHRQQRPGSLDQGVSPMGIDLGGDRTLITYAGTDEISVEALGAPARYVSLDGLALASPHGVAALADGRFWVSSPVYGAFGLFDADGTHRRSVRVAPTDAELLRSDEATLQHRIGERMFYEGTRAGISCQSCHLHGGSDGARHNIGGNTLVATLDVRGLLGTPPFLRDGGYPMLGSLDEVSHTLYRGYRRPQGGRRVSLDRYLGNLPRPTPFGAFEDRDLERERRGRRAFERARCSLCHAPPAYTNLGAHPAEALFPAFAATHPGYELDTPSLLNLRRSAPYLVDGRAQTLRAVFEDHDSAHRHGDTGSLSPTELDDLLYFLEGL
ncbi:MAG: hypothetical protein AB8I08_38255 [Sandaracinaceae bacterium]